MRFWRRKPVKPRTVYSYTQILEHTPLHQAISHLRSTALDRDLSLPRVLAPLSYVFWARPMKRARLAVAFQVTQALHGDKALWKRVHEVPFVWVNDQNRMRLTDDPRKPGSGWIRLDARKIVTGEYVHEALNLRHGRRGIDPKLLVAPRTRTSTEPTAFEEYASAHPRGKVIDARAQFEKKNKRAA